eukprot:Clim_evm40s158 gene=Clim_evmTU40s158
MKFSLTFLEAVLLATVVLGFNHEKDGESAKVIENALYDKIAHNITLSDIRARFSNMTLEEGIQLSGKGFAANYSEANGAMELMGGHVNMNAKDLHNFVRIGEGEKFFNTTMVTDKAPFDINLDANEAPLTMKTAIEDMSLAMKYNIKEDTKVKVSIVCGADDADGEGSDFDVEKKKQKESECLTLNGTISASDSVPVTVNMVTVGPDMWIHWSGRFGFPSHEDPTKASTVEMVRWAFLFTLLLTQLFLMVLGGLGLWFSRRLRRRLRFATPEWELTAVCTGCGSRCMADDAFCRSCGKQR